MYHNSSQKRHWTFASEEQLARLRADANRKFKCKAVANGKLMQRRWEKNMLDKQLQVQRGQSEAAVRVHGMLVDIVAETEYLCSNGLSRQGIFKRNFKPDLIWTEKTVLQLIHRIYTVISALKVLPNDPVFLEPHEEMTLCKYYEKRLLEFCSVFKPAMPRSVVGTACMYFKRFYLNNSVMEYHPRIIMLTCAFLACKVDEFNVSSPQFVGNLRESPLGQEKALEQILEYELLLIQQLNFHLIVHNPYRPFEGFLIDIKTRYPVLENPEILRKTADDFLNRIALTDAYLLYTPSQIALTAILSSASRAGIAMESYLSESLMLRENRTCLSQLLDIMKSMRNLVKKYEPPRSEEVAILKQKLERCHSAEFALSVITKKRKGYEDDDYVSKKSKHEEEEWTDDDLVDSL
ncbi:Cyclin-H [Sciurus carolinensis]|uniref:Cyclin-H n=1 Tax=Sciurus carolinensis TaxID=30640 RepID=A0AA41NG29_SCICA|nr:Cyclin-H [Sciurus carolinensis]